jgi:diguanylate cyclase (GGDEF)-like protein
LAGRRRHPVNPLLTVDLEELYSLTILLAGLSDTDDIVTVALRECRRLFGVTRVELRLPPSFGGLRCVLEDGEEPERVLDPPAVVSEGLTSVAVPLGELGDAILLVEEREAATPHHLRFLAALGASLGTALVSSQRLDRLRLEVAAREYQALHDGLTGLANRTLFSQVLGSALEERAADRCVGVVIMDLDGFRDINDTLGHHTGDAVLDAVAARVTTGLGWGRPAARLGGDEFAFVVPGAAGVDEVCTVAADLRRSVSHPVTVDGMALEVRASLGVAVAPADGTDVPTLMRRADAAMYAAKAARTGLAIYNRDMDEQARRRLMLTSELRRAVEQRQLEIWYQPLARLSDGEVTGMEALLRWRHPDHGPIAPVEFIPVAEQSGLIEPLTWWVLESALGELAEWRRAGYELTMAVNVSARSLTGSEVAARLEELLGRVGIPPGDLTLEITESLMMTDPDRALPVLDDLDRLGVRIAIDDFGTGYSSLSRLRRLPVHTVKVDRSFVMSMHRDEGDEAIVRATIELARNMGHDVIAEGVERQDTWERLTGLGCDLAQGHLLAPAMPIDICRSWLTSRQTPRMAPIRPLRRAEGA